LESHSCCGPNPLEDEYPGSYASAHSGSSAEVASRHRSAEKPTLDDLASQLSTIATSVPASSNPGSPPPYQATPHRHPHSHRRAHPNHPHLSPPSSPRQHIHHHHHHHVLGTPYGNPYGIPGNIFGELERFIMQGKANQAAGNTPAESSDKKG